jgi:hypothetical protein
MQIIQLFWCHKVVLIAGSTPRKHGKQIGTYRSAHHSCTAVGIIIVIITVKTPAENHEAIDTNVHHDGHAGLPDTEGRISSLLENFFQMRMNMKDF